MAMSIGQRAQHVFLLTSTADGQECFAEEHVNSDHYHVSAV